VVVEKQLTQKTSESVFDFKKFKADAEKKGGKLVEVKDVTVAGYDLYLYYSKGSTQPVKILVPKEPNPSDPIAPRVQNCIRHWTDEGGMACCNESGNTCNVIYDPQCGGVCVTFCRAI